MPAADAEMDSISLLAALRRHRPDAVGVRALRAVSGGASQEIWSFDAVFPSGPEGVILRRSRQWSEAGQQGSAGMAVEAALLRAAAVDGVPVPDVIGELAPADALGEGYFMRRVEGESAPRVILKDVRFEAARRSLAAECGRLMARIHRMPRDERIALRTGHATEERARWAAAHRANGTLRPVFELALRWLADNEPPRCKESVVVHGDFRNGNLIVSPDGVCAVLDWELAHLGDPMEDLGWFCVNSWRFGQVGLEAGGLGTREQLFAGYEAEAGRPVDPGRVRYWQVLGSLKWGVTCDAMGRAWRDGSDRKIERLAVAQRVSEAEIDLLTAMFGVIPTAVVQNASTGRENGRSNAGRNAEEIATAVQELLGELHEALPSAASRLEARIGKHLAGVIQREVELGTATADAERHRLQRLLDLAEPRLRDLRAELCRRIDEATMAFDTPALLVHLQQTALDRLSIEQPGYVWGVRVAH